MDDIEDILRRRMQNTGETYEEARRHVLAMLKLTHEQEISTPPGWEKAWQEEPPVTGDAVRRDLLRLFQGMPPACREVARRLPPMCLVRANRPLNIPAHGTVGFVYSYREKPDGGITVSVLQHPEATIPAECEPAWLEAVGYRQGLRPEDVDDYLQAIETVTCIREVVEKP